MTHLFLFVAGLVCLLVPPSLLAFDMGIMLAVALSGLTLFITLGEIARMEGGVFAGHEAAA
jgi:cation:H+ antiporter